MALTPNPFDWLTFDWVDFRNETIFDGTFEDLLVTEKEDDPEQDPPPQVTPSVDPDVPTAITDAIAAWSNAVDSFVEAVHEAFEGTRAFRLRESGGDRLDIGAIIDQGLVRRDADALVSDQLIAGDFPTGPGILTPAMIENLVGQSVIGREPGTTGAPAAIVGTGTAEAPQVFVSDGTAHFTTLALLGDALGVLHEQDLATLATNAFTDGAETIGTLGDVTVVNTANAGANWGLVNATGLRMSLTTGLFDSSNLTAPYFYFPVSQLPGFRVGKALFIDIVIAASTFASGNDRFLMGLWAEAGTPLAANISRNRMGIRGNNGGTDTLGTQQAATRQFAAETLQPTAMSVRISPEGMVQVGHGSYAGAWPAFDYVQGQSTLYTTINHLAHSSMRVTFAMSTGAGLAGSIDISRWRFRQ